MTNRVQTAIEELLRMWLDLRSDAPVSELWNELVELDKAYKADFFPRDVAGSHD